MFYVDKQKKNEIKVFVEGIQVIVLSKFRTCYWPYTASDMDLQCVIDSCFQSIVSVHKRYPVVLKKYICRNG